MINIINYISVIIIPLVIVMVILYGISEKKNVYDIFLVGVKNGIEVVIKIFPTLLAIFLAINMLNSSGVLNWFIKLILPMLKLFNIPVEIMPLALLRPISGSASMAVATDIIKNNGVDSKIGLIASTIMGATETTFYTIALYASSVKINNTRFVLFPALITNIVGVLVAVVIFNCM